MSFVLFLNVLIQMVRAFRDIGDIIQLCDVSHVWPTGQALWKLQVQDTGGSWDGGFFLLCCWNARQNDSHGSLRLEVLLLWPMEYSRFFHRCGWVSFLNYLTFLGSETILAHRQIMDEDNEPCTRECQCRSVLCWRWNIGSASAASVGAARDLPKVTHWVSFTFIQGVFLTNG